MQDPSEDDVAAELRLVLGRVIRKLRQAKTAVSGVSLAEAAVLVRLDRDGPDSPSSLAALEGVRPQAMAVTLGALEERALIGRAPDPADGRRSIISVTAAGRKVVSDRHATAVGRLAHVLGTELTAAERAELRAALRLLERVADRL